MANDGASSIGICALRVARLDATGAPVAGATNGYCTNRVERLILRRVNRAGADIELENGCGALVDAYKQPDVLKRYDVEVVLTAPDPELEELLAGLTLITQTGAAIGVASEAVGANPAAGVCLEAWSKAWLGGGPVASSPYMRYVVPWSSPTYQDTTLENAFLLPSVVGPSYENPNITADGPFNDWPTGAAAVKSRSTFRFRDSALPTTQVGYIAVPAQP